MRAPSSSWLVRRPIVAPSSVAALHKSYIDWALTMIPGSKSPDAANALNSSRDHYNHGLFKLIQNGASVYVYVLTAQGVPVAGKALRCVAVPCSAVTVVDTVVEKVVSTGKVSVMAADAVAKKLQDDDKAVLYGIFFDSGKSELKPESLPQIAEIAKMLRAESLLNVFIVGHIDSEGVFEANLALSQRRAEAMARCAGQKSWHCICAPQHPVGWPTWLPWPPIGTMGGEARTDALK